MPTQPGYKECSMSFETISKWNKYFTFICCQDYKAKFNKIGETGEIVEIDESMFGKMKYGRGDGRKRRKTWVFGGVDRSLGRAFLSVCPNNKRTKKALWPIIQANISLGTTIYFS